VVALYDKKTCTRWLRESATRMRPFLPRLIPRGQLNSLSPAQQTECVRKVWQEKHQRNAYSCTELETQNSVSSCP